MRVCVGVKSVKFGEPWDGNTEPSIGLTTYEGVETRYWNCKIQNITYPRKTEIYFEELKIFSTNILRYSPSYTKQEGIEQEDKKPLG